MRIVLIRFAQRKGAAGSIPWHFGFFKDILEPLGHTVDIIDQQVEGQSVQELVKRVVRGDYELVATGGIGTVYLPLKRFCRLLKALQPDARIVVGGHIVADYEFLLNAIPIDLVVLGEGEVTLGKIVDAIENDADWKDIPGIAFKRDGRVVATEPEKLVSLDDLPDFNLDTLNLDLYNTKVPDNFVVDERARQLKRQGFKYLHVYLARGCPYNCFFCYRHLRGYRTYGRERLEQILSRLKKAGFSFFGFGDECVTANKKNLRNICEICKRLGIYWTTSGRVDHLTPEVFQMLKDGNCVGLQFGVESFDQGMLNAMNKKTTVKHNIDAMNGCYLFGLDTALQLIIGTPGEDRETIFNTRKGMWQCWFKVDRIACAVLNPYPGSPAYYYGIEKGLITDRELLHREVAGKDKIVINFSKLSNRELHAWQKWLHLEAALSYRLKHRTFMMDRSFLWRILSFGKAYLLLFTEPLHLALFSAHVLKGFRYWRLPVKRPQWGESLI